MGNISNLGGVTKSILFDDKVLSYPTTNQNPRGVFANFNPEKI